MALNSRRIRRTGTADQRTSPGAGFWRRRGRRLCTSLKSNLPVGYARHADVISGVHALIFLRNADGVRAFFRGMLGFESVRRPTAIQPTG